VDIFNRLPGDPIACWATRTPDFNPALSRLHLSFRQLLEPGTTLTTPPCSALHESLRTDKVLLLAAFGRPSTMPLPHEDSRSNITSRIFHNARPTSFTQRILRWPRGCDMGWMLVVEFWDCKTSTKSDSIFQYDLDCAHIPNYLEANIGPELHSSSFRFPIEFSSDLTRVGVLSSVYPLVGNLRKAPSVSNCMTFQLVETLRGEICREIRLAFSGDNRYFARLTVRDVEDFSSESELAIFDLSDTTRNAPVWTCSPKCSGNPEVALHPTFPLVAWSSSVHGTYVCSFDSTQTNRGECNGQIIYASLNSVSKEKNKH